MTLSEYYKALEEHDWFYEYSDDHRVYKEGLANKNRLLCLASGDKEKRELYTAFHNSAFFDKPRPPCPKD